MADAIEARPTSTAEWAIVRPLVNPVQAVAAWKEFQKLKHDLLDDDDSMMIGGKPFIKKSGWLKLATPFNLTDEILEEDREDREDGSFVVRFRVRVSAPNGRTVMAVGSCDSKERPYAHLEHDVRATAHTRAKARAIADMVGGGGAIAEDVAESEAQRRNGAPTGPSSARPAEVGEGAAEYDPAQNPETITCPKCGEPVTRGKNQRTGKFYYFCHKHHPELRLRPGDGGKGEVYA